MLGLHRDNGKEHGNCYNGFIYQGLVSLPDGALGQLQYISGSNGNVVLLDGSLASGPVACAETRKPLQGGTDLAFDVAAGNYSILKEGVVQGGRVQASLGEP